jgi:hypothetical protein
MAKHKTEAAPKKAVPMTAAKIQKDMLEKIVENLNRWHRRAV